MTRAAAGPLRLAILVGGFPVLSETFVLDHIVAMIRRGHAVDIYPASAEVPHGGTMHPEYAEWRLEALTHRPAALPTGPVRRTLARHLLLLRRGFAHPAIALRSLAFWRFGRHALSGHLFHLADQFGYGRSYDVVHAHFGWTGLPAQWMRDIGALRGPLLTTFHGSDITVGFRPGRSGAYARLWAKGDWFTANSEFTRTRMVADGCPASRIEPWPMGVPNHAFVPGERPTTGRLELVGVGRLSSVKGWDLAVQALARLPFDVHFHLVGGGGEEASLRSLVARCGVVDRVTFHGAVTRDQVRTIYQRASAFILPGRVASDGSVEAQGVVIAEAQAAGLPCVVGDLGGMPEGIVPDVTGFTFPAGDVAALAAAVARWHEDRGLLQRMGRAARQHAAASFGQEPLFDRIEARYRELVRGS